MSLAELMALTGGATIAPVVQLRSDPDDIESDEGEDPGHGGPDDGPPDPNAEPDRDEPPALPGEPDHALMVAREREAVVALGGGAEIGALPFLGDLAE